MFASTGCPKNSSLGDHGHATSWDGTKPGRLHGGACDSEVVGWHALARTAWDHGVMSVGTSPQQQKLAFKSLYEGRQ